MIDLSFQLVCTVASAKIIFRDPCTGTPLEGIAVSVSHQPDGTACGSGASGADGSFTFPKKCGPGRYVITWTGSACWLGGSTTLNAAFGTLFTPCSTDTFYVGPSPQPTLVCCPAIGLVPRNLMLSDSLGTTAIDVGGGVACNSGTRDHSGDRVDFHVKGRIELIDDGPGLPCWSPGGTCGPEYSGWAYTTRTVQSGLCAVTYTLLCGEDGGGGYFQLVAHWPYCWSPLTDFTWGSPYWCAYCGGFLTYAPGTSHDCLDFPVVLTRHSHRDLVTNQCLFDTPPIQNNRTAFWYYNGGCPAGSGGAGCNGYGAAGHGGFCFSEKLYYDLDACRESFTGVFTLVPGPNEGGTGPFIWTYESPAHEGTALDYLYYQPEPPGGTTITVSS